MTIGIRELEVHAILGLLPHERRRRQRLTVDIELDYDASTAEASDDIADALDYRKLVDLVRITLQTRQFELLEAAVAGLSDEIFRTFQQATRLQVTLRKYRPIKGLASSWARHVRSRR